MSGAGADRAVFVRNARTWRNGLILAAVAALIVAARLILGASWLILAPLAALTLPAAWDFARNATCMLVIDEAGIEWRLGRRGDRIDRADVARVVTARGLDLSLKMFVVPPRGRRRRIPSACLPPRAALEEALVRFGYPLERNAG